MGALEAIHMSGKLFISQNLLQPSIRTSSLWLTQEKLKSIFIWENHCSPALLKVLIYSTVIIIIIIFVWKVRLPEILFFRAEPAQRNYLHFFKNFKTAQSLRVNETKLTLRNAFISDHLALKESKYDERTLFWGSLQKLFLPVNP